MLTHDMRRIVGEQRLGFVATVCPDGTPNLSPKGTVAVWDETHLVFADIWSPGTVANLRANPAVELNVVDPFARRGYRFTGRGTVLADGPVFTAAVTGFRERGVCAPIRAVALVALDRVHPVTAPIYVTGVTEAEVRARWEPYYVSLMRTQQCRPEAGTDA